MSSLTLDVIKKTGETETGKPQKNRNNSNVQKMDDFYEFLLMSFLSIIISLLPLVCAALFSQNKDMTFWDHIVGKPDILFTILTLAVNVVCEIGFLEIKKNRFIKASIPFLLLCILWLVIIYGYYQFPGDGSLGMIYKNSIIGISAIIITGLSILSMFVANKASKNIEK